MVAPLAMMGLQLASNVVGSVASAVGDALSSNGTSGNAATRKTSDDFETMFLEQSFDRLTENGGAEGPLGENGTGGSVYRSMLSKQYAASIVKSGGVGISSQIYGQMLKLQEGGNGGA